MININYSIKLEANMFSDYSQNRSCRLPQYPTQWNNYKKQ